MGKNLTVKISALKVMGKVKAILETSGQDEIFLMRIVGRARNIKRGVSNYGEWIGFTGVFKATNIITGDTYEGGKELFVPECASALMEEAMVNYDTGEISEIEVAFDIGARKTDSSVGYEYIVMPLFEIKQPEVISAIEAGLPPLPKMIEAPVIAPEIEPEKDSKKKK